MELPQTDVAKTSKKQTTPLQKNQSSHSFSHPRHILHLRDGVRNEKAAIPKRTISYRIIGQLALFRFPPKCRPRVGPKRGSTRGAPWGQNSVAKLKIWKVAYRVKNLILILISVFSIMKNIFGCLAQPPFHSTNLTRDCRKRKRGLARMLHPNFKKLQCYRYRSVSRRVLQPDPPHLDFHSTAASHMFRSSQTAVYCRRPLSVWRTGSWQGIQRGHSYPCWCGLDTPSMMWCSAWSTTLRIIVYRGRE